jgi:N-acetyl-anhydromuramyl-L-alanine amidase AmpD
MPGHGTIKPYGLLVHSTGDGIPAKAIKEKRSVAEVTEAVYRSMGLADGLGPHYAICPDGTLLQFREENIKAWHAGVSAAERNAFLTGTWDESNRLDRRVVEWWKLRWPAHKSPSHLYPSKSPNDDYIGVELVPCGVYQKNDWIPALGAPVNPKGRYTAQQYMRLAELAVGLGSRWTWATAENPSWWRTSRLVGHCDVNPLTRQGWDPGAFHGWFSWSLLQGMLDVLHAP